MKTNRFRIVSGLLYALLFSVPFLYGADVGPLGVPIPVTAAKGGTGSTSGALGVACCTIPDSAAANSGWCDFAAANSGNTVATFDTLTVRGHATCSTTYPQYELHDRNQNTNSSAITSTSIVTATTAPVTLSINGSLGSATATDDYNFMVSTAGSGCSTTLATEFMTLCVSWRQ